MQDIDYYLRDIFAAHDVTLIPRKGWLASAEMYPCCRSHVRELQHHATHCSISVDVEIALNDECVILESFGDTGPTPNDALANSCRNFTASSLHVLLSAVWNRHNEEQVLRETWVIDHKPWQVFLGNIVRKAADGIEVPVPNTLVPTIETLFSTAVLSPQPHWLCIYYANISSDNQIVEVLLDNEIWEHGQDMVRRIEWPVMESFYSARMFLMIVPTTPTIAG